MNKYVTSLRQTRPSLSGQAMVEMAVALVVILVLFAGLIQVGRLANAGTRTMIAARYNAGLAAMSDSYGEPMSAMHILNWTPGQDGRIYTAHDVPFIAPNAADTVLGITSVARPEEIGAFVTESDVLDAHEAAGIISASYLVHGRGHESFATLPVVRRLIYDRPTVSTESHAWLVWTSGIY